MTTSELDQDRAEAFRRREDDDGASEPIHPEVRIGHAHLRVADLRRAAGFYRDRIVPPTFAPCRTIAW